MRKQLRAFAVALVGLSLASCAGGDGTKVVVAPPVTEPDVMGSEWDIAKNADVYVVGACGRLFKNGVTTGYGDARIRAGNSVYVSGGDVYVACEARPVTNDPYPLLWVSGEVQGLEGAGHDSDFNQASQVLVSGGDVYVAGYQHLRPALWVNGKLQLLGGGGGSANCVFVSGKDVYVGGSVGDYGVIWKNGAPQTLRTYGGRYAKVYSVHVSGGDVYAAVTDWVGEARALLFKNGEAQVLPGNKADAMDVAVSGGDVYVVGNETHETAKAIQMPVLWKNGAKQRLTDGSRFARVKQLLVSGGDVYVVGYDSDQNNQAIPTLWINGKAMDLRSSGLTGMARGVFVVEKGK